MAKRTSKIALLGFGEAGQAFVEGWGAHRPGSVCAYDRKTDHMESRAAKIADYDRCRVDGADSSDALLVGADVVLSLVTADQALSAARIAALTIQPEAVFLDMNSVSPATKRLAAEAIKAAGALYVDVAVMAPVRPALISVPLLVAGPDCQAGLQHLSELGFTARAIEGEIGAASAIKMIRSIMVKGLEALTAECLLAAAAAGVQDEVLKSLEASDPGFGWSSRADYNLDRMLVHGRRRAAEMGQAMATADALGLGGDMASATVTWQSRLGELDLTPPKGLAAKLDAVLAALQPATKPFTIGEVRS